MKNVSPEAHAGQGSDLSSAPAAPASDRPPASSPSPRSFRPLRWDDLDDARAWLDQVRTRVDDLAALGREGARRRKNHVLSRAERAHQVHAAITSLGALLDAARAGLPTPPTEDAEEGGQGE